MIDLLISMYVILSATIGTFISCKIMTDKEITVTTLFGAIMFLPLVLSLCSLFYIVNIIEKEVKGRKFHNKVLFKWGKNETR